MQNVEGTVYRFNWQYPTLCIQMLIAVPSAADALNNFSAALLPCPYYSGLLFLLSSRGSRDDR